MFIKHVTRYMFDSSHGRQLETASAYYLMNMGIGKQ